MQRRPTPTAPAARCSVPSLPSNPYRTFPLPSLEGQAVFGSISPPLLSLHPVSYPSVNTGPGALVKHVDEARTYGEWHACKDGYKTHTHRWILRQHFQHKVTRTYACQHTPTIKGQIVMGDRFPSFPSTEQHAPPPFVTRHSVFNWILKGLRYGNSQFPPFTGRTLAVKYASWSPRVIRFVCCRFSLMLSRYSCTSFRSAPFNCKHAINQGCSETRSISCISINQQLRWDLLQLHNKTNSVRLIGKEWDTK